MWGRCCPKCGGAIYSESYDGRDYDLCCLQCGKVLTQQEELALVRRAHLALPPHIELDVLQRDLRAA